MTRRKMRKKPTFLAVPVKVQALAEVFSGASLTATGRKYGVSPSTVYSWKKGGFKWKDGSRPTGTITINGVSTIKGKTGFKSRNNVQDGVTNILSGTNRSVTRMKVTSFGITLDDGHEVTLTSNDLSNLIKINTTLREINHGLH